MNAPILGAIGSLCTSPPPGKESQAVSQLSDFEKRCIEHYAHDPWFINPSNLASLRCTCGLYYYVDRLLVPIGGGLRDKCLTDAHSSVFAGDGGFAKTQNLLTRLFWWPKMVLSIKHYIKHCSSCHVNKPTNQKPAGLLMPLKIQSRPWGRISMDLITALPQTGNGYTAILVFVDRLSKMSHFVAAKTELAAVQCAASYMHHVIRLHVDDIVSDRDPRFTSKFFSEFCRLTETKQHMSSAFHPQSDGPTERVNLVLEDMLRHYGSLWQDDGDECLDALEFACHNSWHQSVQTTPFKLIYGIRPKSPSSPSDAMKFSSIAGAEVPAANALTKRFESALKDTKECLAAAQDRQKQCADPKRRDVDFSIGGEVLLSTPNLRLKSSLTSAKKLTPEFIGPFKVQRRVNAVAYELVLPVSMKIHNVFHISLLKPYFSDGSYQPLMPTVFDDEHLEYTVERMLDHRDRVYEHKICKEYLVHWEGFGTEHNTREPEAILNNRSDIVSQYWMHRSEKPTSLALPNSQKARERRSEGFLTVIHLLCHSFALLRLLRGICFCKSWAFWQLMLTSELSLLSPDSINLALWIIAHATIYYPHSA